MKRECDSYRDMELTIGVTASIGESDDAGITLADRRYDEVPARCCGLHSPTRTVRLLVTCLSSSTFHAVLRGFCKLPVMRLT